MVARVIPKAVWVTVLTLIVTGCGRQVVEEPSPDLTLLATGPNREALTAPPPYALAALDAAGGLAAWMQVKKLDLSGTVAAYQSDGSFYLTEHGFALYPWAEAIQVSAHEPRAEFVWHVVRGQYRLTEGSPNLDVSALRLSYREYADAVFQIVTAPVRLLDREVTLSLTPAPVRVGGRWYQPVKAAFLAKKVASKEGAEETVVPPYWAQGVYFQSQDEPRVDLIWLANPAARKFLLVRGYDYAPANGDGVLFPTRVEIFESDADGLVGERLVQIDLKRQSS